MKKIMLLVLLLLAGCAHEDSVRVERVIDGDTLELENGSKVRLLGINTPEKGERLWEEARITLSWIEGSEVLLERDMDSKDRYGRLLMYVYADGEMLNRRLVEKGLAHVYRTNNRMHLEELSESEEKAREKHLGIWEESAEKCVELLELNPKEEFFVLENNCPYAVNLTGWKVKDEATNTFEFQKLSLGKSMVLRVHSGEGEDNSSDVYWGKGNVWNNDYDKLFLTDEEGFLVAYEKY